MDFLVTRHSCGFLWFSKGQGHSPPNPDQETLQFPDLEFLSLEAEFHGGLER